MSSGEDWPDMQDEGWSDTPGHTWSDLPPWWVQAPVVVGALPLNQPALPPGWTKIMDYKKCNGYKPPKSMALGKAKSLKEAWRMHNDWLEENDEVVISAGGGTPLPGVKRRARTEPGAPGAAQTGRGTRVWARHLASIAKDRQGRNGPAGPAPHRVWQCRWYMGTIKTFDDVSKKADIQYDDGESETDVWPEYYYSAIEKEEEEEDE